MLVVNIFVLVRPTASKGRRRGKENFRTHAKLSRKKVSRVEEEKNQKYARACTKFGKAAEETGNGVGREGGGREKAPFRMTNIAP